MGESHGSMMRTGLFSIPRIGRDISFWPQVQAVFSKVAATRQPPGKLIIGFAFDNLCPFSGIQGEGAVISTSLGTTGKQHEQDPWDLQATGFCLFFTGPGDPDCDCGRRAPELEPRNIRLVI